MEEEVRLTSLSDLPGLDLAVVTHRPEGIKRVGEMLMPPVEGVRYVVSWQNHEGAEVPAEISQRPDVKICRLDLPGVSNNRNNALENCEADLVLMCDDDMKYYPREIRSLRKSFQDNPDADFMLFRVNFGFPKSYPDDGPAVAFPFPKGYYVSNVEIAVRRDRLDGLRYRRGIGPGTPLATGEDAMFVIDAVRKGMKGIFKADVIGEHPHASTGQRVDSGILRGQGFLISEIYGLTALPRLMLKARRVSHSSGYPFFKAFFFLLRGALSSCKR